MKALDSIWEISVYISQETTPLLFGEGLNLWGHILIREAYARHLYVNGEEPVGYRHQRRPPPH